MFLVSNILFDWNWCTEANGVISMIKNILNILHIIVPIALIALTTVDIMKKVINPEEKDGQKKIMVRAIAALIVFFVPTLVRLTLKVIDWGKPEGVGASETLSQCWDKS